MRNQYSISEFVSNVFALGITRVFFPGARFIRRPVYIRGKKHLCYGKGFTTGHNCRFDLNGEGITLQFGENCEIGDNVHIVAHESVKIGSDVLMASKIFISDTNHGNYTDKYQDSPNTIPNMRKLCTKPVSIGNRVWIGENVVILPGVSIGDGCIIGANSVVNRDIEMNTIAAGSPAKQIKKWNLKHKQWLHV